MNFKEYCENVLSEEVNDEKLNRMIQSRLPQYIKDLESYKKMSRDQLEQIYKRSNRVSYTKEMGKWDFIIQNLIDKYGSKVNSYYWNVYKKGKK